jgi:predicted Zn-dependent protease
MRQSLHWPALGTDRRQRRRPPSALLKRREIDVRRIALPALTVLILTMAMLPMWLTSATSEEHLLRQRLSADPSSFEANFALSVCLRSEGRIPESIELARRAIDLSPETHVFLRVHLMGVLLDAGLPSEAEEQGRLAMAQQGEVSNRWLCRSMCKALRMQGKHAEARQLARELADLWGEPLAELDDD